jgi:hypothetical protein
MEQDKLDAKEGSPGKTSNYDYKKGSFAQTRKLPNMLYNLIGRMIMRASVLQCFCEL